MSSAEMMGRGSEEGCVTEEELCPISSEVPRKHSSEALPPPITVEEVKFNFYDQALKALSERSPFQDETEISRVINLPHGLSDFLSKCSYSRKRHKKSGNKSSGNASVTQSHGSNNIWSRTEDYFRLVKLPDIDNLVNQSSFTCSTSQSYFSIPILPSSAAEIFDSVAPVSSDNAVVEVGKDCSVFPKDLEMKEDGENKLMEIDNRGAVILSEKEKENELEQSQPTLPPPSSLLPKIGLEWLLGARNKILLTSERPSKRRKLLGSAAGLEKLIVVCPTEGENSDVCHFCCAGDSGEPLNKFLVCDSCKVRVHQKCYGVQDVLIGSWLCSWCKLKGGSEIDADGSELLSRPCLLCPKPGGALKPVKKEGAETENEGLGQFAHLFCSQWMPEVYVEDIVKMEPIMNIEGIKDTRSKLVCQVCKVKFGACVRCSHGTCRTAFHPICAREANHRMEIWGKIGYDNVELRAFCSKHSENQDINNNKQSTNHLPVVADRDSTISKHSPIKLVVNKPNKLKFGLKNGKKVTTANTSMGELGNSKVPLEEDTMSGSGCGDGHEPVGVETLESGKYGYNPSDSTNIVRTLKKLVERGKATLDDMASEFGISSDSLEAALAGDKSSLTSDLRDKMVKWLRCHAYIGGTQQNSKGGTKFAIYTKDKVAEPGCTGPVVVAEAPDDVPFKSVPPRRRTKSSIRIFKDNEVVCSAEEKPLQQNGNELLMNGANGSLLVPNGDVRNSDCGRGSVSNGGNVEGNDSIEKILAESSGSHGLDSSLTLIARSTDPAEGTIASQNTSLSCDVKHHVSSVDAVPGLMTGKSASCSYIHPVIQKKLIQNRIVLKQKQAVAEICDTRGKGMASTELATSNSEECVNQDHIANCVDTDFTSNGKLLKELVKAREMGILELAPEDEVEGELVYFQNKLLDHTIASKGYSDELVSRVVKSLPQELDVASMQRWDLVLVNQYLCGLREVKKQGRKEKRHKEAQAVLAAATAAAAASSRISSFRKDAHDESAHLESQVKANTVSGRTGPYSQLMPRAKETLSRLVVGRSSSEKQSDIVHMKSGGLKEHQQSCEICKKFETLLNPIFVCCNCKVAVHLSCYRSVKDHSGPWYCELCEELWASEGPTVAVLNSREKPCVVAQCNLCGGTTGAFRRSKDGQWVHAFCAEWLLESTFRRGQQNLVEGLETISRDRDICGICCRKFGMCMKCNYGNCQGTFHPSCARNAGFYMHVRTSGSKLQHKAYCEKHSPEQREKAESLQLGAEELKSIKQIRVELERVRLLCERIIKREKVKREMVICSHDILASKRDSVAMSVLVRSPFFLPDVSSESATTSLRGHADDKKSCNNTIQRSDDITVDTAVSGKRRIMFSAPMDIDQKTDDSSTSQGPCAMNTTDRVIFSGKKLPQRPLSAAKRNLPDDSDKRSKSRKHTETFQKELVMTSDQASLQNQRLPKGFAYVPVVCLPKEKPPTEETVSQESVEPDG